MHPSPHTRPAASATARGRLAAWATLACAAAAACTLAAAEPVAVQTPSGTLRLQAPAGYTALTDEELQTKFGRHGRRPLAAWGNARRSSTVAVTWSRMAQKPLTPDALPAFMSAMETTLPRLTPGLVMRDASLVTIGGRAWVRMDSTAPAADTDVRNLMYLTDLNGHMVGVNYNATVADFPAQEPGFGSSAGTLRVQE